MNIFMLIYTNFFWQPLFNALVFLYNVLPWHDLGLAIVVLTIIIRLLLAPLFWKAQQSQKSMAAMQPELKKIQIDLKHDREAQSKAMVELYAKHNMSPLSPVSGCLVMLIQLPILFALFGVFRAIVDPAQLSYLYSFVTKPEFLDPVSFGLLDLAHRSIPLGVLAAISQYFQIKLTLPGAPAGDEPEFARAMRVQAPFLFPAVIFIAALSSPAALGLYWTVLNVFGILQELMVKKLWKQNASLQK
ncbi:MAG: YidC/Oxa1 family membrane protein insertase [Candidatus Sungbacteria bacterium]|nr:YidC/Oxa1 family membrane protein insertase [Candidatus Sungbacteria bacterium]